jgi:CRISPR-associated endonuclease/helicase Cas3
MSDSVDRRILARDRLTAALGGEKPFPWQIALLDRFLDDGPCPAIDVPTGLGKTAVMPIWLMARAAGAHVPRRLVYVVDRRAVVDQATAVAEALRALVASDPDLARDLRLRGPLSISTLRGKRIDNREWLSDPTSPAIVLGTVDMVGSRLLFQGYGVSQKMRPYHAGLLGADTLIVLDEAHLTPPFERLISAVALGQDSQGRTLRAASALGALVPVLRFMSLSATGRADAEALTLSDADRDHPVVARRLRARKRVSLRDEVLARDLSAKLAEEAWAASEAGARPLRCVVYCDRRDDAKKVREDLIARAKKADVKIDTELFVGGRRLHERERAAGRLSLLGFLAGDRQTRDRAAFVIATSAGEVGVDLDADAMVADLVPWERMVQRLGRVNRRGDGDAAVVVVPTIPEKADPDTKARLAATRELFAELPSVDGAKDASPGAIAALKAGVDRARVARASTPAPLHPPLVRATVEAWSMTSVEEHTGRPEVAPWIRGWIEREEPQTTVVWREHLPITDRGVLFDKSDLESFRDAANPHLAERLETETWRVMDWLARRLQALAVRTEGTESLAEELRAGDVIGVILDASAPGLVRVNDLSDRDKWEGLERTLSGRLLMVDARIGGLRDGLLDDRSDEAEDVSAIDGVERVVPFRIRRLTPEDASIPAGWRGEARISVAEDDDGAESAWLVVESRIEEPAESEEGRSVTATRAQALDEHESWAEEAARRIATGLELPEEYAEMLATAARLHDEGKRAPRWQQAFHAPQDAMLAKTTSRPNLRILDGYRHELGSLPRAERHERFQALSPHLRDLVLHLIAAHHGNARPVLRTDGAEEPPVLLTRRAREIALRFTRLEKEWGPWGLAWWEALLRAADQEASRRNDEQGVAHG